jgi:serine/threonine-protein kinase RsbT
VHVREAGGNAGPRSSVSEEILIPVESDSDIVAARHRGRILAEQLGFGRTDQTLIATAISELARNIVLYATRGEIVLREERNGESSAVTVIARDRGPGILSIEQAMREGFSTSRSLGLGLPGVRRLMDDFEIVSQVGLGTTVTAKKWHRS